MSSYCFKNDIIFFANAQYLIANIVWTSVLIPNKKFPIKDSYLNELLILSAIYGDYQISSSFNLLQIEILNASIAKYPNAISCSWLNITR